MAVRTSYKLKVGTLSKKLIVKAFAPSHFFVFWPKFFAFMKFWKSIFFAVCAFMAVASTVTYTSCEKDACDDLKCKNGGSCAEGFCRCKTGYEGAVCELKIADRFLGTYVGYNHCRPDPSLIDTVDVIMKSEPNVVEFYRRANPNERYSGTVNGYYVVVDDKIDNGVRTHVTAIVDVKEFTLHVEKFTNIGSSVCDFVGYKK